MSSTGLKKHLPSLLFTLSSTLFFKSDGVHESPLKSIVSVSRPPYLKLWSAHSTRQTRHTEPEQEYLQSDVPDKWMRSPCQDRIWEMAAHVCMGALVCAHSVKLCPLGAAVALCRALFASPLLPGCWGHCSSKGHGWLLTFGQTNQSGGEISCGLHPV